MAEGKYLTGCDAQNQVEDGNDDDVQTVTVEELLISCVMARPPLWDSRLPLKERGKTICDSLWIELYEEFGSNPEFSKDFLIKKWRNLRDTYVRIKGKYIPSGSGATIKKKWEFFESLTFLNDTLSYRTTVTNVPTPSTSSTPSPMTSPLASEAENKPEEQPAKKRKLKNVESDKIEGAILDTLSKINCPIPEPTSSINPICMRLSEILAQMPQGPRTALEIKLLQVAYDTAKEFLQ